MNLSILLAAALLEGATVPATGADRDSALRAAGFVEQDGVWRGCDGMSELMADDLTGGGAMHDVNGDGLNEMVLKDQGTACYGMTGQGYAIVGLTSRGWILVESGAGIPTLLDSRGKDGWRDIEVGGPGFCFPVRRWDGTRYVLHRHQYDGKTCKP